MEQSVVPESHRPGNARARLAAAATAAAGVLHVGAAVPHVPDDVLMGIGFVIVGWLQLAVAALLLVRGSRRSVLLGAVAIHLASIGAWAMSRTVGLPVGHPGVDPVALPDALTVLLEVVGVALAGWSLRRPVLSRPQRRVVAAGVAATWMLAVVGSAVGVTVLGQADAGGGHGHDDEVVDGHDEPALATQRHGDEEGAGPAPATGSDALHEHDDDTVHLHDRRDPHVHGDDIVHLHGDSTEQGAGPSGDDEGHTHAPGEEH